jgi:hypothetical protein
MFPPGAGLEFVAAGGPVREPVTKIGGLPVWLDEPQWPISRSTGEPMQFLAQFALDGGRLAYLFMSEDYETASSLPDAGDNALLIQPGGRVPDFVTVRPQAKGPGACVDHLPRLAGRKTSVFLGGPGVEPDWIHEERYPEGDWELLAQLSTELDDWLPYMTLAEEEAGEDWDETPCYYVWGRSSWGTAWAFVSPDGKEGRFLWDCV